MNLPSRHSPKQFLLANCWLSQWPSKATPKSTSNTVLATPNNPGWEKPRTWQLLVWCPALPQLRLCHLRAAPPCCSLLSLPASPMPAWTLLCHLHLPSSLAGSHHQNSSNQLGCNSVRTFPRTKGWFSHRAEPIWQLDALPSSLRLQPTSIRNKWDPQALPWGPWLSWGPAEIQLGEQSNRKEAMPAKALLPESPLNKLRVGILGNRSRILAALGQASLQTSRPEGRWAAGLHLLHTAELPRLPATTARPLQAPSLQDISQQALSPAVSRY